MNGTHGNQLLEGVEVVLRAGADGDLVPVAETTTDRYGKFVFEQVPLEPTLVYLPGANRDGVHYPGQRVRLDPSDRIAQVTIVVFDAVSTPCPLVAKRHDIDVTVDQQVLKITESLLISNPSRATYVGQSMGNGPPVTFWLSIPKNFDRVTFDKEFFGRRFFVVDHRPITEMPWLPGEQELRFTYRVPLVESAGQFRRALDVPSSNVRVQVHAAGRRPVSCNLPPLDAPDRPTGVCCGGRAARTRFHDRAANRLVAVSLDALCAVGLRRGACSDGRGDRCGPSASPTTVRFTTAALSRAIPETATRGLTGRAISFVRRCG